MVAWRGDQAYREIASQGLINFRVRNYPESLPRTRNVDVEEATRTQRRETKQESATPGAEYERGDKTPGVHAEEMSDGLRG